MSNNRIFCLGGKVLIPCYPSGIIFELFENVSQYLGNVGLSSVPMYFISPVAETVLAYSDIIAEWVCKSKQDKVYLPEPPFIHTELVKNGQLKHFSTLHESKFASSFKEPCIVFTGHPSLRCGNIVHLINIWKNDPKNCIIFIEPAFDPIKALTPFEPISFRVHHCPIDNRMNSKQMNDLLRKIRPRRLLVPRREEGEKNIISVDVPLFSYNHLEVLTIDIKRKYEKCNLSPELSTRVFPQPIGGKAVCSISALLSMQNGYYTLDAIPPEESDIPPGKKQRLLGSPTLEKILLMMRKEGIEDVEITQKDKAYILKIPSLNAEMILNPTETSIQTEDDTARGLLKEIILKYCCK